MNKTYLSRILEVVAFVCIPLLCFAAPEITFVSGEVTNGSTLLLGGNSFGNKDSATPLKWDNFENGTTGNDINGWRLTDADNHPVYSNSYNRPGSNLNCYSDNGTDDFEYNHGGPLSVIYATFWMRSTRNPIDDMYNNKWFKIWHDISSMNPTNTIASLWSGPGTMLTVRDENSQYQVAESVSNPHVSTWERYEVYFVESSAPGGIFDGTADGVAYMWQQSGGEGYRFTKTANYTNIQTNIEGATNHWQGIVFAEYNRSTGGSTSLWYDDVYIDNTQARVEIGDNPVWENCTHREIQIPTAWSNNSVQLTINQGSFDGGESAYVFVVDENGDASTGYPIVFGESHEGEVPVPVPDTGPPAQPSGVSAVLN